MRARIPGENLGKRKAVKPSTHWQLKRSAAIRPSQLCSVYKFGFGGDARLWLSKAAWKIVCVFCDEYEKDLEADDHDDKGSEHDGGVADLKLELVSLVPRWEHTVHHRAWIKASVIMAEETISPLP
jgi:hypothetical protein